MSLSSIIKQLDFLNGVKPWMRRFRPFKWTTLGLFNLYHPIKDPSVADGFIRSSIEQMAPLIDTRLVLLQKGTHNKQQAEIDFLDTFSLVAKHTAMRVFLSIAPHRNWNMFQLDLNNVFLNSDLIEEVYMDMPLGYLVKNDNMVCKLTKSSYGLCQASRQWFHKFSSTILDQGF